MIKSLLQKSLLGMALLGISGALDVQAGTVTLSSTFQGGESVKVKYTGQSGWQSTTAGAFTEKQISPGGPDFQAFCVSLNVSVGSGPDTIHANVVSPLSSVTNSFFTNSAYSDVGNRLAFLLTNPSFTLDKDYKTEAMALAIWSTIDSKFSYKDATSSIDYWFGKYTDFDHNGYNKNTLYGGADAKLFVVDAKDHYQNLIGLTPSGAVPEPASIVSAVVGLAGISLAALRRSRKTVA